MTVITGGPEHLYVDQVPAPGPWNTGFEHGEVGQSPEPPALYGRADRAAYFQGHIRGTLSRLRRDRLAARNQFTPSSTGVPA